MEDDFDFKSVRKNFFAVNILLYILWYTNPDLSDFSFFSISLKVSKVEFYFGIWLFYLYYSWRFAQEVSEKIRTVHENFYKHYRTKYSSRINEIANSKIIHEIKANIELADEDKIQFQLDPDGFDLKNNSFHYSVYRLKVVYEDRSYKIDATTSIRVSKELRYTSFNFFLFDYLPNKKEFLTLFLPLLMGFVLYPLIALYKTGWVLSFFDNSAIGWTNLSIFLICFWLFSWKIWQLFYTIFK